MDRQISKAEYETGKNILVDFLVVCCIVCRLGFPGILSEYYVILTPLFDYGSSLLQVIIILAVSGDTVGDIKLLDIKKKYGLVYLMIAMLIAQALLVSNERLSELTTCIRFTITAVFGLCLY